MKDTINYLLNKLIGVKIRFRGKIIYGSNCFFLPHFSIINLGKNNVVSIGDNCLLGVKLISESSSAYFKFGNKIYVGKSQIICRSGIEIEDNVFVSWGVVFYDHDSHSLDNIARRNDMIQVLFDYKNYKGNYLKNKNWDSVVSKPIKVCKDSWIGMDALILKGVTIGEGSIVAARSVVTKDVPPYTIVAGNPAVVVRNLK